MKFVILTRALIVIPHNLIGPSSPQTSQLLLSVPQEVCSPCGSPTAWPGRWGPWCGRLYFLDPPSGCSSGTCCLTGAGRRSPTAACSLHTDHQGEFTCDTRSFTEVHVYTVAVAPWWNTSERHFTPVCKKISIHQWNIAIYFVSWCGIDNLRHCIDYLLTRFGSLGKM